MRTPLPGLLRDVMGTTVKDYMPIYGERIGVKFSSLLDGPDGTCGTWADVLQPSTATALATYTSGNYAGDAAITINSFGKGKAVYLGADFDPASLARVMGVLLDSGGIKSAFDVPHGVELCVPKSGAAPWVFLLNHSAATQAVTLPGQFRDLLTGATHTGKVGLDAYEVRVLQPV